MIGLEQDKEISPDWPAPANTATMVTTRVGGVSAAPYASLNLALHVQDDPALVGKNREVTSAAMAGATAWQWLHQVHGNKVHRITSAGPALSGDGLVTQTPGLACCVLTADCLPVLLCNTEGTEVAIAHCGWRGLAKRILTRTVARMNSDPAALLAWLGPAIGPCHFVVAPEVRDQLLGVQPTACLRAQFTATARHRYRADLAGIARCQLQQLGIRQVYGGEFCTYCDNRRFFSYRRDGITGRQLSAIYLHA